MKVAKVCLYSLISSIYMFGTVISLGTFFVNLVININGFVDMDISVILALFVFGGCSLGLLGSCGFISKHFKYLKVLFYWLLPLTIPYLIFVIKEKQQKPEITQQVVKKITFIASMINLIVNWMILSVLSIVMIMLRILSRYYEINWYIWGIDEHTLAALKWTFQSAIFVGAIMAIFILIKVVMQKRVSRGLLIASILVPQPISSFFFFFNLILKKELVQEEKIIC